MFGTTSSPLVSLIKRFRQNKSRTWILSVCSLFVFAALLALNVTAVPVPDQPSAGIKGTSSGMAWFSGFSNPIMTQPMEPAVAPPIELFAPIMTAKVPSFFAVPFSVDDITDEEIFAFQFNVVFNHNVVGPAGTNFGCSTAGTIAGDVGLSPTCNVEVIDATTSRLRVSV